MSFTEFHWKPQFLKTYGLPDIGYPVPTEALGTILTSGGDIDLASLLYWLQEYSATQSDGWLSLEEAMHWLVQLLTLDDDRNSATVRGDDWFLEIGPVDLTSEIVTIQRGVCLLAAIVPRDDFRLRAAVFRPLDADTIQRLIALSKDPHPEYGVNWRENNWQLALDSASHSISALYAYEAGHSYMSYWDAGLGVGAGGTHDNHFYPLRDATPTVPSLVATQLGVYYEYHPSSSN